MKKLSTLILIILLCSVWLIFLNTDTVKAQSNTIYIKEDGSVEGTDKIQWDGGLNRFVLLDNIVGKSIVIERTLGTFDGNGFTMQGNGNGTGIYLEGRGTIENVTVTGFSTGISIFGDNHKVVNCQLIRNDVGISIKKNSYRIKNSIITGNNISQNNLGLRIEMGYHGDETDLIVAGNWISKNNVAIFFTLNYGATIWSFNFQMDAQIYKNSFIENNETVNYGIYFTPVYPSMSSDYTNIWDDGLEGNFWSFYNGTDTNNDGIIDTSFNLGGENIDNYPLVEPAKIQTIPEFSSLIILPMSVLISIAVIFSKNRLVKHNKTEKQKKNS